MTLAHNIKFPVAQDAQQPARTSFTRLDNATDLAALYALPNALLKPALCLLEHRHMRPLHWGEVATTIGRGATQTREALARLAELGYAVVEGDLWSWAGSTAARKSVRKPARKSVRKSEFSPLKKTVWGGISLRLKEVNEVKKENTNNTTLPGGSWPAQFLAAAAVGTTLPEDLAAMTGSEGQAPDGAAPGGASLNLPSHSQEKTVHQDAENENATDLETVPARPAAAPAAPPATYREAQNALDAAGALDIWRQWVPGVPGLARNRAAQDAQILQFAGWVAEGFTPQLREHVLDIVTAGSFAHPYPALKARMEKARAVRDTQSANAAELDRVFGAAQCQPGERRRAPDGQVWTVEYVEYGLVYFAEAHAPLDQGDAIVARWPLDGAGA